MLDEKPGEIRCAEIRRALLEKYRAVSRSPAGHFAYPVGRESLSRLGYEEAWLAGISPEVIDRFVGVGNPFCAWRPRSRDCVLDLGCGAGMDAFVASLLVGAGGQVVGLDLTPEMLEWPRKALSGWPLANVEFREGDIGSIPFAEGSFDGVLSNGVLNLAPDKARAFREIHRVLRPGGVFAAADLLVVETVPPKVLADMDAWST